MTKFDVFMESGAGFDAVALLSLALVVFFFYLWLFKLNPADGRSDDGKD